MSHGPEQHVAQRKEQTSLPSTASTHWSRPIGDNPYDSCYPPSPIFSATKIITITMWRVAAPTPWWKCSILMKGHGPDTLTLNRMFSIFLFMRGMTASSERKQIWDSGAKSSGWWWAPLGWKWGIHFKAASCLSLSWRNHVTVRISSSESCHGNSHYVAQYCSANRAYPGNWDGTVPQLVEWRGDLATNLSEFFEEDNSRIDNGRSMDIVYLLGSSEGLW